VVQQTRRKTDGVTWQKISHNIGVVGSALAAILVGFGLIGTYYINDKTIETNAKNLAIIAERLDEAESELDKREVRIGHNEEEIKDLRKRVRRLERGK